MTAISKIQASLAQTTQETTFALANANFDFSLIKITAPEEYVPLSLALPDKKRTEAETGSVHVTARRLGSLFHSMLPETPKLIEAYGKRASEIAESLTKNSDPRETYGPFQEYVGIDGTSIWAAATSSSAAIACHLLACMLACYWLPREATTMTDLLSYVSWVELVSERKRKLEEKVTNSDLFDLTEAVSSRLTLDEHHLAAWDNSARAWLAAANDSPVIQTRQRAVMGLLDKVQGTVHNQKDVYTSVTETWAVALDILEKVIGGMSCSISDGAVIVALMSWHLYPDLILYPETHKISQKDHLVPSSQITIGLARPVIQEGQVTNGVEWSLSLAHLRYYGNAGITSRSLGCTPSGGSKFTIDEFTLVFIGALIGQWSQVEEVTLPSAIEFIVFALTKVDEAIHTIVRDVSSLKQRSWIKLVLTSLRAFEANNKEAQRKAKALLNLGWRYHDMVNLPGTFGRVTHYESFGMGSVDFCQALRQPEDQDAWIRDYISRFKKDDSHRTSTAGKYACLILAQLDHSIQEVILYPRNPQKLVHLGITECEEFSELRSDGGYVLCLAAGTIPRFEDGYMDIRPVLNWTEPPKPVERLFGKTNEGHINTIHGQKLGFHLSPIGRTHSHVILKTSDKNAPCATNVRNDQVRQYLQRTLDPFGLMQFFARSRFYSFMRWLSAINELYRDLPGASINPTLVQHRLPTSILAPNLNQNYTISDVFGHSFRQRDALKLVAMLETGKDVERCEGIYDWGRTLAISVENRLYIHPKIVGSPHSLLSTDFSIRCVQGNIGRPGLAIIGLMTHPTDLNLRSANPQYWQLVNHDYFDGKLDDRFPGTSMHLRLTGFSRLVDYGGHHRISDGVIVDAVISSFDQGQWIGDIDVLGALASRSGLRTTIYSPGTPPIWRWTFHTINRDSECNKTTLSEPSRELVAIDNWEELLSPHPSIPGVIRCYGNWQARLTAISLCRQLDYQAFAFEDHGCWECAFKIMDEFTAPRSRRNSSSSGSRASAHSEPKTESVTEAAEDHTAGDSKHVDSDDVTPGQQDQNLDLRDPSAVSTDEHINDDSDSASSSDEIDSPSSHVSHKRSNKRPVIFIL
ncbi:hypothetical protein F5Y18DRAFT_421022 [Xylariaceae sp. FL1019]|nr:hypothetical protein F5Y18DRAFT_421022 [Xylariaceae sp. FL1019]